MFSTSDTIVAIATPPGRGGIGVVRISGPDARTIAAALLDRRRELRPRVATFARVKRIDALDGEVSRRATTNGERAHLDNVIATSFPKPASYTGEDVVEISAHGSPAVLRAILEGSIRCGARLAEPGEFTLRAFLNGRLDLIQAEAVADLIDAVTPLQARVAFDQLDGTLTEAISQIDAKLFDLAARFEASLDFPDEGYHFIKVAEGRDTLDAIARQIYELIRTSRGGRIIREGRQVAIVGKPNVGKSSLFNYLVGSDRAIVTPIPGTTRDLLTEAADVEGVQVRFVDTAGIRDTADVVETEGVQRARRAAAVADLTVVVLDRSRDLECDDRALVADTENGPRLIVVNKIDLPPAWTPDVLESKGHLVELSLKTGEGVTELRSALANALNFEEPRRDVPIVTNVRHIGLLERARDSVDRALEALARNDAPSEEFVLADLSDARHALEEITGTRTSDDLLHHIFSRFCVGK